MLIYSVFFSSLFIYLFRVYSAFEIEGGKKRSGCLAIRAVYTNITQYKHFEERKEEDGALLHCSYA